MWAVAAPYESGLASARAFRPLLWKKTAANSLSWRAALKIRADLRADRAATFELVAEVVIASEHTWRPLQVPARAPNFC